MPTIHLGHIAHNLEKKGIKTERGNENRRIARINAEIKTINAKIIVLEEEREIEIRLINQPIKPRESVRDYIRKIRLDRERKSRDITGNNIINQPIKPHEVARDYVREARPDRERPSRDRPERGRISRHIERAR